MATIQTIVQFFLDLGASVFLPVIIFILALIFGAKPGKSIRAALMVGVGFVGINLVLGLLVNNMGPAAKAMVERSGVELSIIDVGWPASAAIAFGSNLAALVIPAGILLNLVLLFTRVTKTINIDIWNFWHFAFAGALVQAVTGNIWYGLISAMIFAATMLFFADWTAPAVQQLMGMPGISLPHGASTSMVPFAVIVNKIIDLIPGLNKMEADPEAIKKRFGVLGEPVFIGVIIGLAIAALGYAGSGPFATWFPRVLQSAISMGAVMVLMPRMVALLMEGLIPLSEAAREFLQKRAGGREIYLGLDSAIAIGHPASIATSLLMVPVVLVLAVILPGNRVLPFGDLATIPFMVCMMIPVVRGNVVRATITSTIIMIPTLYIMNALAAAQTTVARSASFNFPEGASTITSMVDGGNFLAGIFVWAANNFWIGNAIILAVLVIAWTLYKKNSATWERVAGYRED
ncbi:MAG: galactitol system component [Verrucomicrobiota bacterium]|jgi:PTS system galactitol-specific IIC component|nr:galactitol system component [Verrucomicrobiota bacterium]MDK2964210.1 galactitol system component [Verrucomicrobiota bacterium]